MKCYYCGLPLDGRDFCPSCRSDVHLWKKINGMSNFLYNEGLEKARVRDLSGAVESLRMSLRYNKDNIPARNLLGLVLYEMGETVSAFSEWVISRSRMPEDNPATGYLAAAQNSANQVEQISQTIRKFNQSINYCRQGNYDMAVLQLKKVISLNPGMVRAHQLLALLYIREKRYDLAMRALKNAEKIDANNTNTRRYMQECREHLRANGKLKSDRETPQTMTYRSGNDIIIRPTKFTDNTAVRTVINLLMGAAIGIAVVCFLVVPEIKQNANASSSTQLVEANQSLASKDRTIAALESEIEELTAQIEEAQSATTSADETAAAYRQLLSAYASYVDGDYEGAGDALTDVDKSLLGKAEKKIYNTILAKAQAALFDTAVEEGMSLYAAKDYEAAIEVFLTVAEVDPSYNDGEIAYYLAFAYNYLEDYEHALKWFNITLENTSSSRMTKTSTSMATDLEAKGYQAAE